MRYKIWLRSNYNFVEQWTLNSYATAFLTTTSSLLVSNFFQHFWYFLISIHSYDQALAELMPFTPLLCVIAQAYYIACPHFKYTTIFYIICVLLCIFQLNTYMHECNCIRVRVDMYKRTPNIRKWTTKLQNNNTIKRWAKKFSGLLVLHWPSYTNIRDAKVAQAQSPQLQLKPHCLYICEYVCSLRWTVVCGQVQVPAQEQVSGNNFRHTTTRRAQHRQRAAATASKGRRFKIRQHAELHRCLLVLLQVFAILFL